MASESGSGGGIDLMTFVVGLLIFGALAQVAYKQFARLGAPVADNTQQESGDMTATSTTEENASLEVQ